MTSPCKPSRRRCFSISILAMMLAACATVPGKQGSTLERLEHDAESDYRSGKLEAARKGYEELLVARPRHAIAHVRLGSIAYREGDATAARSQYEAAANLDPANAQAKYNLAMLSLNDAWRHLQDYVTIAPPSARNREAVLALLAKLREFAER